MKYFERKSFDWAEEFDGKTLAEARHIVDSMADKFGEDAKLALEYDWESVNFYIEILRTETEEEKEARIAKEKKKEKADRVRYENLKSKYGW